MSALWHALHVKARFEKLVETQLQRKGYEVLLPTYTLSRQWPNRVKTLSLPLFPSYVFCRFSFNRQLPVIMTPGVNGVVGVGKTPLAVDEGEISAIRHTLDSGLKTQPWLYTVEGDEVHIADGPLRGFTGILHTARGCDRLILSVNLVMRSISVEIDRSWARPVDHIPASQ